MSKRSYKKRDSEDFAGVNIRMSYHGVNTEAAWLFKLPDSGAKFWLPKSQAKYENLNMQNANLVMVTIPLWLAEKNGLVDFAE